MENGDEEFDIDQDGNRSLEMLSAVFLFGVAVLCVVAVAVAIIWGT